ncbi:hypothetical protein OBBRIDRAFT_288806 [Obba rivulosa]|uniref:Uncharacterized protein n=1 Tax=Obba rivulosa TaxID=1052685 RepID=A0A8E2APE3_9APHY|nr:hypothetical protein OBBRIDRAFT_288806 [Obba rivulosa]
MLRGTGLYGMHTGACHINPQGYLREANLPPPSIFVSVARVPAMGPLPLAPRLRGRLTKADLEMMEQIIMHTRQYRTTSILTVGYGQVQRFPLHRAISNNHEESIQRVITSAHKKDPASLAVEDELGLTPVHIAALRMNVNAMETLLELGVRDIIVQSGNAEKDRKSPLSLCSLTICVMEAIAEPSAEFAGYCESGLHIEGMLKRAMGELTMDPPFYARKYQWGCTCGMCLGGWLSPRMKFRLQVQADHIFDDGYGVANETMYDLLPGPPPPPSRADRIAAALRFIPPAAVPNPPPKMRKGFWQVVAAVSRILQLADDSTDPVDRAYAVPTAASICEVLDPTHVWARAFDDAAVRAYWEMGGEPEWALDCVTALAMQYARHFDRLVKGGAPAMGYAAAPDQKWRSLPACANDLDWVLVRQNLGLSPREQWGPYWDC